MPNDIYERDTRTMPATDPKAEEKRLKEFEKKQKEQEKLEKAAAKMKPATEKPKPEPKAKAAAPSSDERKRQMKLHKIRLYFAKLGHKLQVKEPKVYPKTDEAIDELLLSIKNELESNGGIEKAGMGYLSAVAGFQQFTQQVWNPLNLNLAGPHASFVNTIAGGREQWQDIVTEFAIDNAEWFVMGPGKRLIMLTIQMAMAVDNANKTGMSKNVPASDKMKEEASDL